MTLTWPKKPYYHAWVDHFALWPIRLTDEDGRDTDTVVWLQTVEVYREPAGGFLMKQQVRLKEAA